MINYFILHLEDLRLRIEFYVRRADGEAIQKCNIVNFEALSKRHNSQHKKTVLFGKLKLKKAKTETNEECGPSDVNQMGAHKDESVEDIYGISVLYY